MNDTTLSRPWPLAGHRLDGILCYCNPTVYRPCTCGAFELKREHSITQTGAYRIHLTAQPTVTGCGACSNGLIPIAWPDKADDNEPTITVHVVEAAHPLPTDV